MACGLVQFQSWASLLPHAEAGEDGVGDVLPGGGAGKLPQGGEGLLRVCEDHVRGHAEREGLLCPADGIQGPAHGVRLPGIREEAAAGGLPPGEESGDGRLQLRHARPGPGGERDHGGGRRSGEAGELRQDGLPGEVRFAEDQDPVRLLPGQAQNGGVIRREGTGAVHKSQDQLQLKSDSKIKT